MRIIDLRSDTVTLPSDSMRQAMSTAKLGDDVFGEDPTINALETIAAKTMGKQAAMLVPSGTMANLTSVLTHCARGEEVILGDKAHVFLNEAGGMAAVGSIHPHTVVNQDDGTIRLEDIEAAIRGKNNHWPRTRLICLENTHSNRFGSALSAEYIDSVGNMAKEHNLKLHIDGARIFNAGAALGVDVKILARAADSVSFCLSKGLAAPVGSLVCGTSDFIAEARRNRKVIGGGMRQGGVLAAAGIVALEEMVDRLSEDHTNAQKLAQAIAGIDGLAIDASKVQTNIIYFNLVTKRISVDHFLKGLEAKGVKILCISKPACFRAVTHYGIEEADIEATIERLTKVMSQD
jgi:threonine aldolase